MTGVLVAFGVSGGFLITQQRAETQARLEEVEQEKAEMEVKLAQEQDKRQEEEVKRQESQKMRLEAEQARVRAEELRRQLNTPTTSEMETVYQHDSINTETDNIFFSDAVETIETLYYLLSEKQFDQANELYSYQMNYQFDPNFFQQFTRVSVEDLQSTYQTSSSINLIVTIHIFILMAQHKEKKGVIR
jgi:hypothetical protein